MTKSEAVAGCILGTAVGDALGLPYEGLSRERGARMLGTPDRYRFFCGRGMVSDDTDHTCFVALALIASEGDVEKFRNSLAWKLRWWLTTVPAGIGLATLRSTLKLWVGVNPKISGVFSAGNGPAMRSAIIGASIEDDELMRQYVAASSFLTHTDPKAYWGALAVAIAAKLASTGENIEGGQYLMALKSALPIEASEFLSLMEGSVASVSRNESTQTFADGMGLSHGVSGYVYHTVPVALHAWLSHQSDYFQAVQTIVKCGGDTDSTAAIVGGIVGTRLGKAGIPEKLLIELWEFPRGVQWMETLGTNLGSTRTRVKHVGFIMYLLCFPRNLLFILIVLFHGFRRLLPPY